MSSDGAEKEIEDLRRERDEYASALGTIRNSFIDKVREFSIIKRTGDAMLANLDRKTICTEIVSIIIEETTAENCSLWLQSKSKTDMELVAARGQSDEFSNYYSLHSPSPTRFKIGEGIIGKVARTGEPVRIENVDASDYFVDESHPPADVKSLLCFPINVDRETIGVLNLSHPDIGNFTNENGNILALITSQAGLAITNYLILEKLRIASKAINSINEGIMVTDAGGMITFVNPAVSKITGYSEEELLRQSPGILKSGRHTNQFYKELWGDLKRNDSWQGEIWNRKKTGEIYLQQQTITATKDEEGNLLQYSSVFFDITDQRHAEEKLEYQAYHDTLTNLPNRLLFSDRLKKAIARSHRENTKLGVAFIDLDNFKVVNDSYGHAVGDQLLEEAAERLNKTLREGDTVARLGGDEFAILVENISHEKDGAVILEKIIRNLSIPYLLMGHEMPVTTSVGMSFYPDDGKDVVTLLKNADTAMYHAKENGKNHYQLFDQQMNKKIMQRMKMENGLRKAIEQGGLSMVYQPKVLIKTGEIVGWEALVRWKNHNGNPVPPDIFIPIAEQTGMILALGEQVFHSVCAQTKKWLDCGYQFEHSAINISARQIDRQDFPQFLDKCMCKYDLDPSYLCIEITESAIMHNISLAMINLQAIRAMGMRISMDDFGTGHSSLSNLKLLPIDELKIDKSFIDNVPEAKDDVIIVMAIAQMAKTLGLTIVVEGIETKTQLDFIESIGCHIMQGYYFSPPVSADKMGQLLAGQEKRLHSPL